MNYKISQAENPATEELQILWDGLTRHAAPQLGDDANTPLTFFLRDADGVIVGGVHGNYSKVGWLYISTLWVSDDVRKEGYGTKLMQQMEEAAMAAGCTNVYLDTFSFQAPEFYKKLGYTVFGVLEDFPVGHSRIFLHKHLI